MIQRERQRKKCGKNGKTYFVSLITDAVRLEKPILDKYLDEFSNNKPMKGSKNPGGAAERGKKKVT